MIRKVVELALVEIIIFLILWLWDGFIAFYLTLTLTFICFAILLVSLIVEWIERTRISKFYFYAMAITCFVPWIAAGIVLLLGLELGILE